MDMSRSIKLFSFPKTVSQLDFLPVCRQLQRGPGNSEVNPKSIKENLRRGLEALKTGLSILKVCSNGLKQATLIGLYYPSPHHKCVRVYYSKFSKSNIFNGTI